MFDQLIELMTTISKEERLFDATAGIYAGMREALMRNGFERDEAIRIICSHNPLPNTNSNNNTKRTDDDDDDE